MDGLAAVLWICSKNMEAHGVSPLQSHTHEPFGVRRLTKVVAEGQGKKGADPALRAAAVGMADKAVGVRVGKL